MMQVWVNTNKRIYYNFFNNMFYYCACRHTTCGRRGRGAHSAIIHSSCGCATRFTRQQDGATQGRGVPGAVQAQWLVVHAVCYRNNRRVGWQGKQSIAEAGHFVGHKPWMHKERSLLALPNTAAAGVGARFGQAAGTWVSASTAWDGSGGVWGPALLLIILCGLLLHESFAALFFYFYVYSPKSSLVNF